MLLSDLIYILELSLGIENIKKTYYEIFIKCVFNVSNKIMKIDFNHQTWIVCSEIRWYFVKWNFKQWVLLIIMFQ